jgi:hypothetical protein
MDLGERVKEFVSKYPVWIILTSVLLMGFLLNNWAYDETLSEYKESYNAYKLAYETCMDVNRYNGKAIGLPMIGGFNNATIE